MQIWAGESAFELFLWKEKLALWECGRGMSTWSLFGIVWRKAQGLVPLRQEGAVGGPGRSWAEGAGAAMTLLSGGLQGPGGERRLCSLLMQSSKSVLWHIPRAPAVLAGALHGLLQPSLFVTHR